MKDKKHMKIMAIFDPDSLCRDLVGKTIKAFGKDSHSYWDEFAIEREHVVSGVKVDYNAWEDFGFVDIFLKDYKRTRDGLIYTDQKFEKNIRVLLPDINISYSEHGMQGQNYVNMDLKINK